MAHVKTWVAVFDGQLARVWEYDDQDHLHERRGDGVDGRGEHARDNAGGGEARHDLHKTGYVEAWSGPQFVEHFAKQLAERARQGLFERLIVAAGPAALGWFRDVAPQELKSKITTEINHDYVHTPVKELEEAISKHRQEA